MEKRRAWAVTEGNLKLVHGAKQAQVQLFDLAADPSETRDLSSGRTEDVSRLTGLYMAWKKDFPPTPWAGGKGED